MVYASGVVTKSHAKLASFLEVFVAVPAHPPRNNIGEGAGVVVRVRAGWFNAHPSPCDPILPSQKRVCPPGHEAGSPEQCCACRVTVHKVANCLLRADIVEILMWIVGPQGTAQSHERLIDY